MLYCPVDLEHRQIPWAGAYQYEVELKNECLLRVGWAALEGRRALGTDERSFGYGGTGMKSNCGRFEQLDHELWWVTT